MDCAQAVADLRSADDEVLTALVVDDEQLGRQFGSTGLRSDGWSVLEAADAIAALAVADAERLNLLVTDFDTPTVTGVSLAEQLRAFDEELMVPVVSAHADAARSRRSLHGRTTFARKPCAVEDLVSSIGSMAD
jgi:CheY-like chemotaxis protein